MALVAFIPAIHKGYLNFFRKYPDELYILGPDVLQGLSRFKYLERDLRMTDPEEVKKMINALGIFKQVKIATSGTLSAVPDPIIMPDDEILHELAEKYLSDREILFESVFLRWGKAITLQEQQVSPHRTISESVFDVEMMTNANAQSTKSSDWWRQIGACVVKDEAILFTAYNRRFPSDYSQDAYGDPRSNFDAGERYDLASTIHAEAWLVAQAARNGVSLADSSMYVTTFPCPTCAKSIAESGVKKLYYRDGYSLLDAEKILTQAGVAIVLVKP